MSDPNNNVNPIPLNKRQLSLSSSTGMEEDLSVSNAHDQPATTTTTTMLATQRIIPATTTGPTEIPSDEGEDSRILNICGGELININNCASSGDVAVVRGGAETPRNVTNDDSMDGEDEDNNDDDDGIANEEKNDDDNNNIAEDNESEYSYTYEDEDEEQFTGFLIPTEQFEINERSASTATTATTATMRLVPEETVGVAVVVAEDCISSGMSVPIISTVTELSRLPHSISRATSGVETSSSSPATTTKTVPETNPSERERKQKWREPTRAAVDMSLRAEKEKTGGRRRLASDLYKIMATDTKEAGFTLEPCDEDSMDKWCIKLFGFDDDSDLAKDLLVCGIDHVELEMSFPNLYPYEPPFVRVVKPRFKRQTGFVMSGALCMELLTKDGWNPVNDIESVIVSIRSLMVVGEGRLQAAVDMGQEEYDKVLKNKLVSQKSSRQTDATADDVEILEDEDASDEDDSECDNSSKTGVDSKRKRECSSVDTSKHDDKKMTLTKKVSGGSYTASEAQSAYDHLSNYHMKEGWDKNGWWSKQG